MSDDCDFRPLNDFEFKNLRRRANGDIVELWTIHPMLTDEQRFDLSPDDARRVEEFDLESSGILDDDVMAQFGIREYGAAA